MEHLSLQYPTAGFLLFFKYIENTFEATQGTFRSLEMYSKSSYTICICSVKLGQRESFRICKGFSFILPKILDVI